MLWMLEDDEVPNEAGKIEEGKHHQLRYKDGEDKRSLLRALM